ncbi:hypothetical protein NMD1_01984 [Novosphingobium sp. MD-1]|nr:hypothetical protein NMD1_01984 [Novosphingobium sp. MD-1]
MRPLRRDDLRHGLRISDVCNVHPIRAVRDDGSMRDADDL